MHFQIHLATIEQSHTALASWLCGHHLEKPRMRQTRWWIIFIK